MMMFLMSSPDHLRVNVGTAATLIEKTLAEFAATVRTVRHARPDQRAYEEAPSTAADRHRLKAARASHRFYPASGLDGAHVNTGTSGSPPDPINDPPPM